LNKGDKPYTARDLASKLGKFWKMVHQWKMVSLGRGCYDFLFENPDDLSRIWAVGTVSLHPGLLRLSKWTKDFNLRNRLMLQYGLGLLGCLSLA
jgi:DMSO/TMAO reductase YedYZ heme-binding membrane subunit